MISNWDEIFTKYVNRLKSPDGRDTYESTPRLVEKIITVSELQQSCSVVEIGSGWGNVTKELSLKSKKVIGIEPDRNNINEAQSRIARNKINNVEFIRGSFEKPNYKEKVDRVISSLTFHQVIYNKKEKALKNVKELIKDNGKFVLCDTMMFFNVENEKEKFNIIYRYLLEKTTPEDIYEKYIKPKMEDETYIYTWEDMKKYTPKKEWYYCIQDLEKMLSRIGLRIDKIEELCPFFGILVIENK